MKIKERPILFNTEMVKAILGGRKTQTRRIIKADWLDESWEFVKMDEDSSVFETEVDWNPTGRTQRDIKCKYGKPGDRLWVRETWQSELSGRFVYKASANIELKDNLKWKPSIHMRRTASRIMLEITDLRVERVQDITRNDAKAEGIEDFWDNTGRQVTGIPGLVQPKPNQTWTARDAFAKLWDSINESRGYGWDKNPWVWVIEFKDISDAVHSH